MRLFGNGGSLIFGKLVLVGAVVTIVVSTLWPFTFETHHLTWGKYVASFQLAPSTILDLPRNILLFMPFGFGLASVLDRRGTSPGAALLLTFLAGLLTTASVESLQNFLPGRTANVWDMIANTLGGVAGLGCFRAWERLRVFSLDKLRLGKIAVVFGAYLFLMLLLAWLLILGVRPGGWDVTYRLALGNELTRDRPWQGAVQSLLILDRAVDGAVASKLLAGELPADLDGAVVAEYPLREEAGLRDRSGRLPDLVSQTTEIPEFRPSGVSLRKGEWLATKAVFSPLAERINATRQFTVALTVATFNLKQEGPARIVTVSEDPYHRNLTLGQGGSRLILRWRSFLTGKNGITPELQFPGVFRSSEPQRLVISCDGITVSLYTPGGRADQRAILGPEAALSALLRDANYWPVQAGRLAFWQSAWLLSALLFLPLGVMMGVALNVAKRRSAQVGFVLGGLLLPALLLEGFVAAFRNGSLRFETIAPEIVVTSLGLILARVWQRQRA